MASQKMAVKPIGATIVWIVLLVVFSTVYRSVQGPLEARMAVMQADGTDSGAVIGSFFARHDILAMAWGVGLLIIGGLWLRYLLRKMKEEQAQKSSPNV